MTYSSLLTYLRTAVVSKTDNGEAAVWSADAWIRHCNATTRHQISVYSKPTFACLYPPHLEKWGVQKNFFARSARESCFVPLTFRIAAPPLLPSTERRDAAIVWTS